MLGLKEEVEGDDDRTTEGDRDTQRCLDESYQRLYGHDGEEEGERGKMKAEKMDWGLFI